MPVAVEAIDVLWYCLGAFLVLLAVGLFYLLVRLGGTVGRLTSLIGGLENEVLPVISKTGGTIDRLNAQLDKVDLVTDSAVDAAESADTAIRAVSFAISRPVQVVAGLASGVVHGASDLLAHRSIRGAVRTGRDASSRRQRDIAEELAETRRAARGAAQPPGRRPGDETAA
jgi:hypothetical protein